MWATFAIIFCAIIAFVWERWSIEAISLAMLVSFIVLFQFPDPQTGQLLIKHPDLLTGFANPALITLLALLIIGQALFNTDALDKPTQIISRLGGSNAQRAMIVILVIAAIISAFMNNTPVVVMFIPIISAIAAQRNYEASRILMPLSFMGILGGMTTLIGSSTNLLVAGVAHDKGLDIGFFDFSIPGTMMAAIGAIYVLFVVPIILRGKEKTENKEYVAGGYQFIAQIEITQDHPLVGIKSRIGLFPELTDMTVRMVIRDKKEILPPFEDVEFSPGDTVVVAATRNALSRALSTGSANISNRKAATDFEGGNDNKLIRDFTLAEVVVAPGSRYSGRSIEGSTIHDDLNLVVLGIQRRSRMPRTKMRDIRLEPGDTLLLGGMRDNLERLRANHDFLLMEWSTEELPMRRYAPRALLTFAGVICAAGFGIAPIVVAALVGAFMMIATHCINIRQCIRAFDSRIFMLVGASLAAATALEFTGGAKFIADGVIDMLHGQPTYIILSLLFLLTALLTNVLSNNATAVLFTPIAINIADSLGVSREAFVVAIIFAANCSFASPVGYQTNLLVMGPGHYKFNDYIKAGLPLVFILWIAYSFIGAWYYGLLP
jgi:di/tricarboxylate transporter